MTSVVDLYASDLGKSPNAVSITDAHLDQAGYYSLARKDARGQPVDRQFDIFGGLRWRFEQFVPEHRRRIDRVSIVRTSPGLVLNNTHTWSDAELNTISCPWHHNLTAAVLSFRAAKALATNASSKTKINTFHWHNSVPCDWSSQQLLDLGLIEPGQWF